MKRKHKGQRHEVDHDRLEFYESDEELIDLDDDFLDDDDDDDDDGEEFSGEFDELVGGDEYPDSTEQRNDERMFRGRDRGRPSDD